MSENLYWTLPNSGTVLSKDLKKLLEEKLGTLCLHQGTTVGLELIPWLEGLAACRIEDAHNLAELIAEFKLIELKIQG